jgi:kynurenine formamidase
MKTRIIDLSVPLDGQTSVFPGDSPPGIDRRLIAEEFRAKPGPHANMVSYMAVSVHSGSHVDAPLHFLDKGLSVADLPLDAFYGEAICIDAPKSEGQSIDAADFKNADIHRGDIVLFRTGWEARAGTPAFFKGEWPGFTVDAVKELALRGAKAIGGDIPSADTPRGLTAGAASHREAAARGLPVFETLAGLKEVVGLRFLFAAFPLKLTGCEASPVRAVAILPE